LVLDTSSNPLPALYFADAPKEVLRVDFDTSGYKQLVKSFGKHQLLPKALGVPLGVKTVYDLTAGLAEDSWALASLGLKVFAYERHPLIGYMVQRALLQASKNPSLSEISKNLQFHIGEATKAPKPDDEDATALFDPMFATEERKSKPSKEMQFMKTIVGQDADQSGVLDWATQHFKRVAVKRAQKQEPLKPTPKLAFEGRGFRFDVYLR
jgi:hypothetical protein